MPWDVSLIPFTCLLRDCNHQVFGSREGAKIYGVLFSAFATASIVGAKLTTVSLYYV